MSKRRFWEVVKARGVEFVAIGVYYPGSRGKWRDGVQMEPDEALELEIESIGVSGSPADLTECLDEHVKADIELTLLERFSDH